MNHLPTPGLRAGLLMLPPVPLSCISGLEFTSSRDKKTLGRKADPFLRLLQAGPGLFNSDTGWLLRINKKGRQKMGDNADLTLHELQAVAALPDLVWHAVLVESHVDLEHGNPQVLMIHRLYAPLTIGCHLFRVKLTVKTFAPGSVGDRVLHALSAAEIENAPLGTLPVHEILKEPKPQAQPTTGRTMTIADLLRGARQNDGHPILT